LDNLEPWLYEAALNEPLSVYIGRENPSVEIPAAHLLLAVSVARLAIKATSAYLGQPPELP